MDKGILIEAKGLGKTYKRADLETAALKDATFTVKKGSFTVILGPSGAGKTTLLNLLGGMDFLTSGSLLIDDLDLASCNKKDLTKYRRTQVGFVFQFYNLMPNLTALENVELAVEVTKEHRDPFETLKMVGLEERAKNFPSQLSGGEQQRVSIARAVAKEPKLLLCDEPTGALDGKTGKEILKVLHRLTREDDITVVIVTHNEAIKDIADQIIRIRNARIESDTLVESPLPIDELEL